MNIEFDKSDGIQLKTGQEIFSIEKGILQAVHQANGNFEADVDILFEKLGEIEIRMKQIRNIFIFYLILMPTVRR